MNEIFGTYAFVNSRMRTNSAILAAVGGRIYADVAPPIDDLTKAAPIYPMIVFGVRATRDQTVVDGESAYITTVFDVKIITEDNLASIAELDSAVFAALHRSGRVNIDNIHIMGCHREGQILTSRVDGDKIYRYSIQTYRIRASRIAS